MDLSSLKPADGSVKKRKRIGRGQGSTRGGTSTRGHKGAQSRSGYSRRIGFEGGQMPLQRRVPKFGFKNPFRKEYTALNLDRLEAISEKYKTTDINLELLRSKRIIGKNELVKVLGNGEVTKALNVESNAFSASAKEAIEKAGGTTATA